MSLGFGDAKFSEQHHRGRIASAMRSIRGEVAAYLEKGDEATASDLEDTIDSVESDLKILRKQAENLEWHAWPATRRR